MFSLALSAYADVIWEPENNDFYDQHREEMTYVNRFCYANGKSGYLEFFAQPEGKSLGYAKNGEKFYISFTYVNNGVTWGLAQYNLDQDGYFVNTDYSALSNVGYVNMQDSMLVYDSQSFYEEHLNEFATEGIDVSSLIGKKDTIFWTYPHSGEMVSSGAEIDDSFVAQYLYKDEEGLDWVNCSYYRGIKNAWGCLSDPSNTGLTASPVVPDSFYPTPTSAPEAMGGFSTTQLAITLVAAVIIITLLLLLLLKKKNVKENKH